MLVNLNKVEIKIFEAIREIVNERKHDKQYFINAYSISRHSGITWKTIDKYLKKGIIL